MYRTIDAAFWTDPKVKELAANVKLLFLYLITNPHTHVSGIYILPRELIIIESGLNKKEVGYGIDTLSRAGFCSFDEGISVIWVHHMFYHQAHGDKHDRGAACHLVEDLHKSSLIRKFCEYYPAVVSHLPDGFLDTIGYPIDTLSIPHRTPDSRSRSRSRSLNPDLDPDPEQDICAPPRIPIVLFGEFQSVKLSEAEADKLRIRLNGKFDHYIDRLDRYSKTHPKKFKAYESHYAVLLNWLDRDQTEGKGGLLERESEVQAKVRRTREASERVLSRLGESTGGGLSPGNQRSDTDDVPRWVGRSKARDPD